MKTEIIIIILLQSLPDLMHCKKKQEQKSGHFCLLVHDYNRYLEGILPAKL